MTREAYRQQHSPKKGKAVKTSQSNPHKHVFRHLMALCFMFVLVVFMGCSGTFLYFASGAPKINRGIMTSDNAIRFYDSQGHFITQLGQQQRTYVPYKNIPPTLINGLTSIEDKHFFTNRGVAPGRIAEAELNDLRGAGNLQGGSTLTQQLVKLSVFSTTKKDQTLKRKAQEALLALRITHDYPKKAIMEYYINKVYMGHNNYGMETASQYYFNKPLTQLTIPQLALLAGMPQSPVAYDPYAHANMAKMRRNQVIVAMYKNHKINAQEEKQALGTSINQGLVRNHKSNNENNTRERIAGDYLKQSIDELNSSHFNIHGGLKVYTNLNMKDQTRMYNLANHSDDPGWPSKKFQVGAALVNSHNGAIQAEIGGRKESQPFGLNRADQTSHSNGSTNKPLMDYGPAFQYLGFGPNRTVEDTPFTYPGTHVELKDFDHHYKGAMSLKDALVQSRNVPAIRTLQDVGVPKARKFMDGLGLPTKAKDTSLQNGIGGYISPIQEAAAYATFANGGIYHQPLEVNHVVDSTGKTHYIHGKSDKAMSKSTAYEMNDILKGVPESEDGDHAKVSGLHEAGKTGTTQFPSNYKYNLPNYAAMDSWYAGYTPNLSMTVWTGYDQPMKRGHYIDANEINVAQRYYKYVMQTATKDFPNNDW